MCSKLFKTLSFSTIFILLFGMVQPAMANSTSFIEWANGRNLPINEVTEKAYNEHIARGNNELILVAGAMAIAAAKEIENPYARGATIGAVAGGAAGSFVPFVGTTIGAIIGTGCGLVYGFFESE